MSTQLDMFDPLDRLAAYWDDANRRWFGGEMRPVPILPFESTRVMRRAGWARGDDGRYFYRIQIHRSLLDRMHRPGMHEAVTDVLLHEMIHQRISLDDDGRYVPGQEEPSHGPAFTAHCNRIGSALGLPMVAERKPRGRVVPLSRYWPVRPDGKRATIPPKVDMMLVHIEEMVKIAYLPGQRIDEWAVKVYTKASPDTVTRKLAKLTRRGVVVFKKDGGFYRAEVAK